MIHLIEPGFINIESEQAVIGQFARNGIHFSDISEIAEAQQKPICNARCTSGASRDFVHGVFVNGDLKQMSGMTDDQSELVFFVIIESGDMAKPVSQRACKEAASRRGANERKSFEWHFDTSSLRPSTDEKIEREIFHGGVEIFFDDGIESMNFVDEEDIAFIERGQDTGEVAFFLNSRSAGLHDIDAQFVSADACERCFTEARRSTEQKMAERLLPHACSLDKDANIIDLGFLTDIIGEATWSQRLLNHRFRVAERFWI